MSPLLARSHAAMELIFRLALPDGSYVALGEASYAGTAEEICEACAGGYFELGGRAFHIVGYSPNSPDDMRREGQVQMTLQVSETRRLHSVATTCGYPPAEAYDCDREGYYLYRDDWRQVEFIAVRDRSPAQAEFADIMQVYLQERRGAGFTTMHERRRISSALQLPFDFAHLRAGLGPTQWFSPLSLTAIGPLLGGWGLETPGGLLVYGVERDGQIVTLGLDLVERRPQLQLEVAWMESMALEHGLLLVDWPATRMLCPGTPDFSAYFGRGGNYISLRRQLGPPI